MALEVFSAVVAVLLAAVAAVAVLSSASLALT